MFDFKGLLIEKSPPFFRHVLGLNGQPFAEKLVKNTNDRGPSLCMYLTPTPFGYISLNFYRSSEYLFDNQTNPLFLPRGNWGITHGIPGVGNKFGYTSIAKRRVQNIRNIARPFCLFI